MFEKRVSFMGVLFLIFEKSDEQNIAPEILRFVSMLFNMIINVSIFLVWMGVIGMFGVCMYAFYEYCYFYKLFLSKELYIFSDL